MDVAGAGWPNLMLLLPACYLASLVSGMAGFAFGAVAVALILPLGPADVLVPLILIGSIVGQVISLTALRRAVAWRKMLPFVLGGLVGVPFGTAALHFADPHAFRISLGVVLVVFSLYGLLRGAAAPVAFGGRAADMAVGAIGGAMGGYAGLSGILPTIWCGLRGWPREEQRAVYQPFIVVIQICALASGGAAHVFSEGTAARRRLRTGLPARHAERAVGVRAARRTAVPHCRPRAAAGVRRSATRVTALSIRKPKETA